MYTVVKDVKIQVEFNPAQVNAYRLVGYESRLLNKEDFNDDTKDAGELGSGHTVTALYEIIPFGIKDGFGSVDPLKYQKEPSIKPSKTDVSAEMLTVKLRYKNTGSNKSALMEIPLIPDNTKKEMTKDFSFAAAVAMFGQLLKNSDFKGDATYDKVIALAKKGFDNDDHGKHSPTPVGFFLNGGDYGYARKIYQYKKHKCNADKRCKYLLPFKFT